MGECTLSPPSPIEGEGPNELPLPWWERIEEREWAPIPFALALSLALLLSPAGAGPARAAGCDASGIQQLELFSNDVYHITVGVLPPNPQYGELRMIIRVCDVTTGEPVRDAQVTLVPTNPEGVRGAPVRALSRFRGPEEYDADMTVRSPGVWRYEITVGATKGSAVVGVTLPVRERPWYGNASAIVFGFVGVGLLGGCVYLYRSSQIALRRRRERQTHVA